MSSPKLDLNLLTVFDALMSDGNLTRAGYRLGLSQPSMSYALAKLRTLCGDELFVRVASGMVPTPYAKSIAGDIKAGIALLQGALKSSADFDPAVCEKTFQIAMSDVGELSFLPQLVAKLNTVAPKIGLRILQLPREAYPALFSTGEVDLAIGYLPTLKSGFYQQRLLSDGYVCLANRFHPRIAEGMTLQQFASESHVVIEPVGTSYSNRTLHSPTSTRIDDYLADHGLQRRVVLRVPHFVAVAEVVRETELVATVPSRAAALADAASTLKRLSLPLVAPRVDIRQFWHQRNHRDPANKWLRAIVADLFGSKGAQAA